MTNRELKRKLIFALNQDLLSLMKDVKAEQERLIIALNNAVKCAYNQEDETRLQIANMDYKRALNRYIDIYSSMLAKQKEISVLSAWEYKE